MKKVLTFIITLIFSLQISSKSVLAKGTITIATSANVQFVMERLKEEFKKQYGIEVNSVVGSSGKLSAQIENGAPFDLFLSADTDFPQKLYNSKIAVTPPKVYAYGTLVLWTIKNIDLSKGINILKNSSLEKIAIANPKNAPYGKEAINTLNYYKLNNLVKEKLVYGESISQVNNYIITKLVDIGFTSKSVVLSPELKNKGKWIEIDKKSYKPIAQSAVILKYGKENNSDLSNKFYQFIYSKKAQEIFRKYGYIVK